MYFRIASFPGYGALVKLDMAQLKPGARVTHDEYEKADVADFALWKAWDPDDGDVAWDAPWGRGRPGWHIECSAMSMKYLGPEFDIHTGGVDNLFPHHEDERAQSEAATGQRFVRLWMHCAHLLVDGRKMSKSLGNFYTLRDVLGRGFSGRELRYVLLSAHYRQPLNFTFEALQAARRALTRLDTFLEALEDRAGSVAPGTAPDWAGKAQTAFDAAMARDLGISEALAAIFEMAHEGHRALAAGSVDPATAAAALVVLERANGVLGIVDPPVTDLIPADIQALAAARNEARRRHQWAEADRLRDDLATRGWQIQDTLQGAKLKRVGDH